jgi:hypothetical protein
MSKQQRLRTLSVLALASFACSAAFAQTRPSAFFNVFGTSGGDHLGVSVRDAGDVNADGYSDVIIGAPDQGGMGAARVISGKDGSVLRTFNGVNAGDLFGSSLAGVGDVDHDGFDDVLIGAPQSGSAPGYAKVYSGRTGGVLFTFNGLNGGDRFGQSVSDIGDLDNNGFGDLAIGAPREPTSSNPGYVRLYSGKDGSFLRQLDGTSAGDQFGFSIKRAGLVNANGCPDLVVGAPGAANGAGYAQVISGCDGGTIHTFNGAAASDAFGFAVSGIGDVDFDGFADVIVGAPGADNGFMNAGEATVFSGRTGTILCSVHGDSAGVALGAAVSEASDVDLDKIPDFIVGAPGSCNGTELGYVLVLSLIGGQCRTIYRADADSKGDHFGAAVSWARDINSDGSNDFVVGASCDDNTGLDAGSARIYSGRVCFASFSNYGTGSSGSNCTPSLSSDGAPIICATVDLQLTNCRGQDTQAAMLVGLAPGKIPNPDGGEVLVAPPWIVRPLTLPAAGLSIPFHVLCDSAFCGLTIYVQGLQLDPGAGGPNQNVSSTQGLSLVIGGF